MSIEFKSGLLVCLLALAGAGFLLFSLIRAKRLPAWCRALRLFAAVCLFLGAVSPELVIARRAVRKPRLDILVDGGRSMSGKVRGTSKYRLTEEWLRKNSAALSARADLRVFYYSNGHKPFADGLAPGKTSSDLKAALESFYGEAPPARYLVLSDGVAEAARANWSFASSAGAPVDAAVVGAGEELRSASLDAVRYPDFAFMHLPLSVSYKVTARGLSGRPVKVSLSEGGKVLSSRVFTPPGAYAAEESSFTVTSDRVGPRELLLSVSAPGPGVRQDSQTLNVQVIHEKRRILYVAGRPSYEYAALRSLLKDDPNNELVTFVILRGPENFVAVPDSELSLIPFPAEDLFLRDLHLFDVVILQGFSFARLGLPDMMAGSIARYMENGGGLLWISGDYNQREPGSQAVMSSLQDILPVSIKQRGEGFSEGEFRVTPTGHPIASLGVAPEEAQRLWSMAAPLSGAEDYSALKTGAAAVLTVSSAGDVEKRPLCAVWSKGKGRVMAMGSASTWRWKMRRLANPYGMGLYEAFWNRSLEYLNGSMDLRPAKLVLERPPAIEGERASVLLKVLDSSYKPLEDPFARVTASIGLPGGRKEPLNFAMSGPGIFRAEIDSLPAGTSVVSAEVLSRRTTGAKAELSIKAVGRSADYEAAPLEAVASQSGGTVYPLAGFEAKTYLALLPPPREVEVAVERRSMASWLWLFSGMALAALLLEFFLRRRKGLI